MKEIGRLLREAREKKGLSLDDISRETKIQNKYLNALEEGELSLFSGEIYIRGALRNYAQVVGINVDEILSFYDQFKKASDFEEKNGYHKKESSIPYNHKEKKLFPSVTLTWIFLFVFIVGCSIWYLYSQGSKKKSKTPYQGGYQLEEAEKGVGLPVEETDSPEITEKKVEKKELIQVAEERGEIVYLLCGVEQKNVVLNFSGNCWIRILQDGITIDDKIFSAGESKSLGDAQETWIRLGNPPAAKIMVNGLEIENLIRFTSPVNIIIRKE